MTQQSDHSSRHAGFELLRINFHDDDRTHARDRSRPVWELTAAPGTFPYFIYWLLFMLGRVSTNCFVMLTGYFMWQSKTKASRLFRIEIQVLFYSLLTFVIGLFAGSSSLSAGTLLRAVFPTTSCVYWFCSCYFILYLAIPLLNKIIAFLTRAQHRFMLLLLFLVFSLWQTICFWSDTARVENGYSYVWFFVLYFTAAYIFHLSDPTVLSPLSAPLCCLFPALCSGANLCLRDRSTDGTGRNARHTRRIPVSDRVFRIRLLLFVLPESQNFRANARKKIYPCDRPAFFWRIICCMTAIYPRISLGKKLRFPVLEA